MKPSPTTLGNTNWGARLSRMVGGWDVSGFYYRSMDVAQTFYFTGLSGGQAEFQPRHERLRQVGATVTKDFGDFVLKDSFLKQFFGWHSSQKCHLMRHVLI